MSRFVRPETVKLTLPAENGGPPDWLLVKKRLTYGEQRAAFARRYRPGPDGTPELDPVNAGIVAVTAYLLDWSLTDADGLPVPIRGVSVDELTSICNALDPDAFTEICAAIDAHADAEAQARAAAKKKTGGTPTSDTTSGSPSAAAGPSATSAP